MAGGEWALRIFRVGPTLAALALGDTENACSQTSPALRPFWEL